MPDSAGLIQVQRRWTWRELDARVDAIASALRERGLKQGDRIFVHSRTNLPMFVRRLMSERGLIAGAVQAPGS